MADTEQDSTGGPHDPGPANPGLARYLAAHAAPVASADAVLRDGAGRVLIVDPVYKDGWDLPGGLLEDELPNQALSRELAEELGIDAEVGRLLVLDSVPAGRWGRSVLAFVFAAHLDTDPVGLVLQEKEIREARWVSDDQALELLAPDVAARLRAALGAERGAHTAVLRDGEPVRVAPRDHYRLLAGPLTAATVLVRDEDGRVLVLEPSYKTHLELPGYCKCPRVSQAI
ncbi:NUDIX hydrolase [Streptomyces sp. BE20]|uniref:NUDIX hydrolase n=1 Tax=Streptomyces sp. BE20 TaxID=3002525 RepID=UPI002E79713E|nr:NUDIX hydrolase [Streptomyces sp. BE20]MEE1823779.1 NUDIX hydrolase [Streptomyces sp. BE20]